MKLYKDLVETAVASYKGYSETIKSSISSYTNSLSPFQVLEFNDSHVISSTWGENLFCEKLELSGVDATFTPVATLPLYDGSFLYVFSNKPARHYTSSGQLIRVLPFKFAAPVLGEDSNYLNPTHGAVVGFSSIISNVEQQASLVLLPVPTSHVVQAYVYRNSEWSFGFTLGSFATAGNGSSTDMDTPSFVAGSWELTAAGSSTYRFRVLVSCAGVSDSGEDSFIKEYHTTVGGVVTVSREISFPGQYLSANAGSLLNGETSNARGFMLEPGSQALWLVNSLQEAGALKMSTDISLYKNQTIVFKTAPFAELPFNDESVDPKAIAVNSSYVAIGDDHGHIILFDKTLSTIRGMVGKDRTGTTNYPFELGSINHITFDSAGNLLICANSNIYKCNLPRLAEQEVVFARTVNVDCRLEKLSGFNRGTVEVSLDTGLTYRPIEAYELKQLFAGSTVYIRVRQTLEEAKENKDPIKEGILIISV